jgi:anti-sigma regulatory factor (Ser/Thr protein kinase)
MDVRPRALALRETISVCVQETTHVSAARRVAAELAHRLDFDETVTGRVALAATETATNLVKHAGRGEILISGIEVGGRRFVELVALDRGPGMANVERCFEDGYSTAGSPGTGLGAVRRLASAVDVYSRPGGTALLARVGPAPMATAPRGILVAGLSVPMSGEACCGDAWDEETHAGVVALLVVDGLGHGADAALAAQEGVRAFRRHPRAAPGARVEALHAALRATRGAAVAVAEIDPGRRTVRFAGLGNISAAVHGDGPVRHLVSNHGTAGHVARKIDEYTYPWPPRGVLVMHSDGVASLRDLGAYPGLFVRDPGLAAGVLYRDFSRRRDDATCVVARGLAA